MDSEEDNGKFDEVLSPDRDFVLYKKDGDIVGGGYQIEADIKPLSAQPMMGGGLADDLLHNLVVPAGLYMRRRPSTGGFAHAGPKTEIPTLTEDIYARLLKIANTVHVSPEPLAAEPLAAPKKHTRRRRTATTKKTRRRTK